MVLGHQGLDDRCLHILAKSNTDLKYHQGQRSLITAIWCLYQSKDSKPLYTLTHILSDVFQVVLATVIVMNGKTALGACDLTHESEKWQK